MKTPPSSPSFSNLTISSIPHKIQYREVLYNCLYLQFLKTMQRPFKLFSTLFVACYKSFLALFCHKSMFLSSALFDTHHELFVKSFWAYT
jgi:hypothetical protein